jgi:RNA polymerase-binding protein DksA
MIRHFMDKSLIQKAQTWLTDEKNRLEAELSKFSHRNTKSSESDFETNFPNLGDKEDENASEVAQFSDNLSLEDELEKALRDVESALKQIEKGEYGICKYCHQKIDERRLLARPTSSSCIQCKKTLTQEV